MRSKVLAAFLLLTPLGACGFTPMYAQPGVSGSLARVGIETPETRTGYFLRRSLEDALAGGPDATDLYRLDVLLDEQRYARGIGSDDAATRYELAVRADWTLVERRTGRVLASGQRPVTVTHDASLQPYASLSATDDAQERAAAQIAQLIRVDLLKFFAGRPSVS